MAFSLYTAVIGVDGSGKSSCFRETLKSLARTYSVIGIGDNVLQGNRDAGIAEFNKVRLSRVKKSLRNISKSVSNPLLYKITKLMELICRVNIQKVVLENYKPQVILGDGSPLINTIGWGIRYHPQFFGHDHCLKAILYLSGREKIPFSQTSFYLRNIPEIFLINRFGLASFHIPDITFFLRITPEVAIERIKVRGKKLQVHETKSFLEKLQNAYRMIFDIMDTDLGKEVHEISVDDISVDKTVNIIMKHIDSFIKKI